MRADHNQFQAAIRCFVQNDFVNVDEPRWAIPLAILQAPLPFWGTYNAVREMGTGGRGNTKDCGWVRMRTPRGHGMTATKGFAITIIHLSLRFWKQSHLIFIPLTLQSGIYLFPMGHSGG